MQIESMHIMNGVSFSSINNNNKYAYLFRTDDSKNKYTCTHKKRIAIFIWENSFEFSFDFFFRSTLILNLEIMEETQKHLSTCRKQNRFIGPIEP